MYVSVRGLHTLQASGVLPSLPALPSPPAPPSGLSLVLWCVPPLITALLRMRVRVHDMSMSITLAREYSAACMRGRSAGVAISLKSHKSQGILGISSRFHSK